MLVKVSWGAWPTGLGVKIEVEMGALCSRDSVLAKVSWGAWPIGLRVRDSKFGRPPWGYSVWESRLEHMATGDSVLMSVGWGACPGALNVRVGSCPWPRGLSVRVG